MPLRTFTDGPKGGTTAVIDYSDMSDDDLVEAMSFGDGEAARTLLRRHQGKAARPQIVKVRRRAVDDALDRLSGIPDTEPGKLAVPWESAPRPKVPTIAWAASDMRLFIISELVATQRLLLRENIIWHLEHLGQMGEGKNANPNILISEGVPLIYDGHHRLAALWLLNVEATNCWSLVVGSNPADGLL